MREIKQSRSFSVVPSTSLLEGKLDILQKQQRKTMYLQIRTSNYTGAIINAMYHSGMLQLEDNDSLQLKAKLVVQLRILKGILKI
jgi:hypothetical protein